MTDPAEDLPNELSRRLRDDENVLHKPKGTDLVERLVVACVEDGLVWAECLKVFRQAKNIRTWEPKIKKMARTKRGVRSIGPEPAHEHPFVRDTWGDAPVSSEAIVPPGWGIGHRNAAIYKIQSKIENNEPVEKALPVSFDPIVITRRIQHKENQEISFELAWKVNNTWHLRVWPRDTVFNSRRITDCAAHGLPVASDNSGALVEYLRSYEHHNIHQIGIGYCRSTTGWLGEEDDLGHHGFLVGEKQLGGNGEQIAFTGTCEFKSAGTFERWEEAIQPGLRWPSLRVALVASLAAPLVGVVGAPNMIIEWIYETSAGKTMALRFGRSAWCSGRSDPPTWKTTVNAIETRAQTLNDLPFFIDDTAQVEESKRRDLLGSAVYMLESGHTKSRANKDMTQKAPGTWRTVVLSTGEYALADYVSTGGAAARVLSFYGPPLGEPSVETGAVISDLKHDLGRHYGHAGPKFVQWLCDNRKRWGEFESLYRKTTRIVREAISRMSQRGPGNAQEVVPATMRLAETIAMLDVTAALAIQAGVLNWGAWAPLTDPYVLESIERAIEQVARASNKPRDALEHVMSVAYSKHGQWLPWGEAPNRDEPHGGWLGWRRTKPGVDPFIEEEQRADLFAWHPAHLKSVLASGGFHPEATLKAWRQQGILIASRGRLTYCAKFAGGTTVHSAYIIRASNTKWSPQEVSGTDLEPPSEVDGYGR